MKYVICDPLWQIYIHRKAVIVSALIDELRRNPCPLEELRNNFDCCGCSDCMRMKKERMCDNGRSQSTFGEGSMTYTKEQLLGVQR